MQTSKVKTRVAIIGAGPAGLAAARALKLSGIDYGQYEKHSSVGGIWDIQNPGTPMYESAHFISSKAKSGFHSHPMSAGVAEYPTKENVLEYLQEFAVENGLLDKIKFNTPVLSVSSKDEGWVVKSHKGSEWFSHVICANGTTWTPSRPKFPGDFKGRLLHSVDYKSSDLFKGKRVLVVGAGNSACDIACDAAQVAESALISMRRGYHFIPKHIFGMPADQFGDRSKWLPLPIRQWTFARLLKLLNGDLSRYGLKIPDHKIFESHPIINSQLLHYLSHGDIEVRGNLEKFEGDKVYFEGGNSETVDVVVLATGYEYAIPYMDKKYFNWTGDKPKLGYSVFNPKHQSLFAIGFSEMNAGGFYIFDEMAALIANAIESQTQNSKEWQNVFKTISLRTDFSGPISLLKSSRHANYLDLETYLKEISNLSKQMGWMSSQQMINSREILT